ncbi:MAG: hypothetical protein ACRC7O_00655 [Fimbriiglobus sp.]
MTRWAAIDYRDFWDLPRIFFVSDGGQTYLFDCAFSDDLDDYPDDYEIYLMPPLSDADLTGSWAGLYQKATAELGRVPVSRVRFDPTKQQFIDAAVLDQFQPAVGRVG